jgi:hypothetical protein
MHVVSTNVEVDVGVPPIVRVNGKRIAISRSKPRVLAGGGMLAYTSNGLTGDVVVTWPDSSQMDVFSDRLAENATFTPPRAGVDTFSGLLTVMRALKPSTDLSNARTERLTGGDGHTYVIDPYMPSGFKTLYGPFANSWKITQKASLFTYLHGRTTRSYDVKGFPSTLATVASLSAPNRAQAQAVCKAAGVTKPTLLSDCELDVGETGQAALATATANVQSGTTSTTAPSTTTTTASGGRSGSDLAPTVAGAVHPVQYYFAHPCEAVTLPEINAALGYPYPEYVSVGSSCPIGTADGDQIIFSHETVEHFKSQNQGSVGSGPVPSLGHTAYCIVKPTSALIQSYVVTSLGAAGSLQILADNCTEATALTKDALSHISGI